MNFGHLKILGEFFKSFYCSRGFFAPTMGPFFWKFGAAALLYDMSAFSYYSRFRWNCFGNTFLGIGFDFLLNGKLKTNTSTLSFRCLVLEVPLCVYHIY